MRCDRPSLRRLSFLRLYDCLKGQSVVASAGAAGVGALAGAVVVGPREPKPTAPTAHKAPASLPSGAVAIHGNGVEELPPPTSPMVSAWGPSAAPAATAAAMVKAVVEEAAE